MTIEQQVIAIVRQTLSISTNTPLDAKTPLLGAMAEFDSMAVVSVLTELERHFGIRIAEDDIQAEIFHTLGTLSAFIAAQLPQAPKP